MSGNAVRVAASERCGIQATSPNAAKVVVVPIPPILRIVRRLSGWSAQLHGSSSLTTLRRNYFREVVQSCSYGGPWSCALKLDCAFVRSSVLSNANVD